jgi:AraC family transcriptional regulator of adaptative response/methylated-DNA-[protein]-cysteine methyltransferase
MNEAAALSKEGHVTAKLRDGDALWRAVVQRDRRFDGRVFFGVRSTGVYCRPSCPARRPRREQVIFFWIPEAAERAGFRPCRRCHPESTPTPDPQLEMIRRTCRYIESRVGASPTLGELSAHTGVSAYHLQRAFKRVVGISPRQYAEAFRLSRFKSAVKRGDSVTQAIYDAGYGSSSRLYERAPATLGMTPATYKRGGASARISYTIAECPLGRLLVAATEKGVCAVRLGDTDKTLEMELLNEYPAAFVNRDERALAKWVAEIVNHLGGRQPNLELPLDVRATAFQWAVWEKLREIPYGSTRSYGEIARAIGRPTATRAVARACATNPVAVVIPCHRVVREDKGLGGYRWGIDRKKALLQMEKHASD